METGFEIHKLIAQILSGLSYGCIYGLFALSIVFLYRANRLFNFATTELATFFTICMFLLMKHMPYWSAFALTVLLATISGCALHIGLMRVITEKKISLHSSETVLTIALFTILNSMSVFIFGDEPERFPTPFHESLLNVFGVNVSSHTFVIFGFAIISVVGLSAFFRLTKMGLLMEATAENSTAAKLRGINTSNILALAWGMTTGISAIAGILIAPALFLSPAMLTQTFSYALIAVAIGGLESPIGAIVGGLLVGVVENLATNIEFIGSELKFVAVFVFLVLVLLVFRRGLWGREEHRRV